MSFYQSGDSDTSFHGNSVDLRGEPTPREWVESAVVDALAVGKASLVPRFHFVGGAVFPAEMERAARAANIRAIERAIERARESGVPVEWRAGDAHALSTEDSNLPQMLVDLRAFVPEIDR